MMIPPHLLQMIRERVAAGRYRIGRHVIRHGVQEGFSQQDVLTEWKYPPTRRRE